MGRILFWYLFRDMLRIFVLAAVVLAGIMSFGGLLRPLTQHGLDALQVAEMWLYLMPAMMTYSLPVAAVFAASMVYGRLTNDNELTACRAAGISYGAICAPAVSLGIVASVASLVFLSFVVPFFSLQAQKVIFDNVAKVITSRIQREHSFQANKGGPTIFAQDAFAPPMSEGEDEQVVVLTQPTIISYSRDRSDPGKRVPRLFDLAREATLFIRQDEDGRAQIYAVLKDATRFTRDPGAQPSGGLAETRVGPITMPSLIQQNVKFMDITRLKRLAEQPERAPNMQRVMGKYIEMEQQRVVYARIADALKRRPAEGYVIETGEAYQITAPGAAITQEGENLVIRAGGEAVRVARRVPSGRVARMVESRELVITAHMDRELQLMVMDLQMRGVRAHQGEEVTERPTETETFTIPMPTDLLTLNSRTAQDYLKSDSPLMGDKPDLLRQTMSTVNETVAELHARASFGVSCLMLVLVGGVLGMQFRSGDFLSAFAVSVIPALVTITLVVGGSQTARQVTASLQDPMWLGLTLIWSGNVMSLLISLILFLRIRRT